MLIVNCDKFNEGRRMTRRILYVTVAMFIIMNENLIIRSRQLKTSKISQKVSVNIKKFLKILHTTAFTVATSATLLNRKEVTASEAQTNLLQKSAITRTEAIFLNINGTAEFIELYCRDYLSLAKSSGKLIYRGEPSVSGMKAVLMSTMSDLLLPSTYSPVAADFFNTLNTYMHQQELNADILHSNRSTVIFPDNGHLATSDPMAASAWGGVVSIWPIDSFHFAWIKNSRLFWNNDWGIPQGSRGPFFWRNSEQWAKFVNNDLLIDKYVESALMTGNEILVESRPTLKVIDDIQQAIFSGSKSQHSESMFISSTDRYKASLRDRIAGDGGAMLYVAVPLFLENQLLGRLQITPFSNEVKISPKRSAPMDLDGSDVRSKRDILKGVAGW